MICNARGSILISCLIHSILMKKKLPWNWLNFLFWVVNHLMLLKVTISVRLKFWLKKKIVPANFNTIHNTLIFLHFFNLHWEVTLILKFLYKSPHVILQLYQSFQFPPTISFENSEYYPSNTHLFELNFREDTSTISESLLIIL